MNTIPTPNRYMVPRTHYRKTAPTRDVTASVKAWGRRGIFWGAFTGVTLGVILVAIPLTTDTLTFGVLGTLMVAAVECAVIGGGFAALAAALFGGASSKRSEPSQSTRTTTAFVPPVADDSWTLPDIQTRINTIDAWEYGNTGP